VSRPTGPSYRRGMAETIDIEALVAEIGRYLDAVAAFREESREPVWLAEREELQCVTS
jgi:hypothetical protein